MLRVDSSLMVPFLGGVLEECGSGALPLLLPVVSGRALLLSDGSGGALLLPTSFCSGGYQGSAKCFGIPSFTFLRLVKDEGRIWLTRNRSLSVFSSK